MQNVREVLERRYRSRALSRRYAKDNARTAEEKGRAEDAARFPTWAASTSALSA